jgi:isocitrate dehydrogenase
VPDHPIIPFVEGDGIGPDIWAASKRVLDAAVEKAYGGKRKIAWYEVFAGEKAKKELGEWLPEGTIQAVREFKVAIKGPLTTPVGGGIRSLNVSLRQILDLFACVRPVKWIPGVPSPVLRPQDLDVVIFRENTEDVYAGIEWKAGAPRRRSSSTSWHPSSTRRSARTRGWDQADLGVRSKRLVGKALRYAVDQGAERHLVHKGNISEFTEGAFRSGVRDREGGFAATTVSEDEVFEKLGGKAPAGKVLVKGGSVRLPADPAAARQYSILATPSLNGTTSRTRARGGGRPRWRPGEHVRSRSSRRHGPPQYAGRTRSIRAP